MALYLQPRAVAPEIRRLLLFCSALVAHLQFLEEYPASLSIRSKVKPSGGSPMSFKKFLKLSQLSQILIPLSP